ncbi:uncharacterized protein LOC118511896 [Anopheles stephensi]|uniref:uncharacterized protein LOC118511896 n=1 Tax=Anopheles stephensi TaxID=30069 RepID=UPI001658BEF1|nr:uncharacterized protein LOC118511896 [Anopheles stephensi]
MHSICAGMKPHNSMEAAGSSGGSSSENIPFCEHYKPLLIEEIALVEHPVYVHYGKCSVIGMLSCTDHRLESLCVPDLPTEMQLPDGACSVELCLNNYCGIIPKGSQVEVTGIVKLRHIPTGVTTDSGMLRIRLQCEDDREFKRRYDEMLTGYSPFIEVNHIRTVTHARELISCNLKVRKLDYVCALDL